MQHSTSIRTRFNGVFTAVTECSTGVVQLMSATVLWPKGCICTVVQRFTGTAINEAISVVVNVVMCNLQTHNNRFHIKAARVKTLNYSSLMGEYFYLCPPSPHLPFPSDSNLSDVHQCAIVRFSSK